jgi:hypothetical protein
VHKITTDIIFIFERFKNYMEESGRRNTLRQGCTFEDDKNFWVL